MKTFPSLEKLSQGITYLQIALAKISRVLLMAGLVLAMVNFLLNGRLFEVPGLQETWAALQSVGVDANLWMSFAYVSFYMKGGRWGMVAIHGAIGLLLLFVACVVTDIESVRQALNITMQLAALDVVVGIPVLTLIRSIVVVLLVAAGGIDDEGVLFSNPSPSPVVNYEDYLTKHPGASVKEISQATGMHQATIRRRLKKYDVSQPTPTEGEPLRLLETRG